MFGLILLFCYLCAQTLQICESDEKLNYLISFLHCRRQQKHLVFFSTCGAVDYFSKLLQRYLLWLLNLNEIVLVVSFNALYYHCLLIIVKSLLTTCSGSGRASGLLFVCVFVCLPVCLDADLLWPMCVSRWHIKVNSKQDDFFGGCALRGDIFVGLKVFVLKWLLQHQTRSVEIYMFVSLFCKFISSSYVCFCVCAYVWLAKDS